MIKSIFKEECPGIYSFYEAFTAEFDFENISYTSEVHLAYFLFVSDGVRFRYTRVHVILFFFKFSHAFLLWNFY